MQDSQNNQSNEAPPPATTKTQSLSNDDKFTLGGSPIGGAAGTFKFVELFLGLMLNILIAFLLFYAISPGLLLSGLAKATVNPEQGQSRAATKTGQHAAAPSSGPIRGDENNTGETEDARKLEAPTLTDRLLALAITLLLIKYLHEAATKQLRLEPFYAAVARYITSTDTRNQDKKSVAARCERSYRRAIKVSLGSAAVVPFLIGFLVFSTFWFPEDVTRLVWLRCSGKWAVSLFLGVIAAFLFLFAFPDLCNWFIFHKFRRASADDARTRVENEYFRCLGIMIDTSDGARSSTFLETDSLEKTVNKWMIISMLTIVAIPVTGAFCFLVCLHADSPDMMAYSKFLFAILLALQSVGDWAWNHRFYFGPRPMQIFTR